MKDNWTEGFLRLSLITGALLGSLPLSGQFGDTHPVAPEGHARNKQRAAEAHEANLKRYTNDAGMLVLPGLVADRNRRRVEVMVERTRLGPDSPCEFTVVAETSEHAYEALLVAFAKPSDVHRALQFIGTEPGEPFDPGANRFWAKGEPFVLSLAGTHEQRWRLEQLLVDRRTGKTLREEGFLFTGSASVPDVDDARAQRYAADEYQPKSIVSLFNSTQSVLQVPYAAPQSEIYQNTIVNPEHELPEGVLVSLIIEPASQDGSRRVKELALRAWAGNTGKDKALAGVARLGSLNLELKDAGAVLNKPPTLLAVLATLARLDRKKQDCYLTVTVEDDVELGDAQALARILSTIDSEKGVRIEPPPAGQLYYKAFTPDSSLLDRAERIYHPWELALSQKNGQAEGVLVRIDSVRNEGSAVAELVASKSLVSGPADLRKALDAEAERIRKTGIRARPPVILVFAPPTLPYGMLRRFLAPALPTHRTVHVYLDTPMPPLPPAHRNPAEAGAARRR